MTTASGPPNLPPADEPAPEGRVSPLAALRHPGYRLLWGGGLCAGAAQQIQLVVNGWIVYELSGSALQLGLNGLFAALPLLLLSLVGGTVADRVDRKRLLSVTTGLRLLPALFLAIMAANHALAVWQIYLATLINTTGSVFDRPARAALIASMVPKHHLTNAITLNSSIGQLQQIVGPAIAGFILTVGGPPVGYGAMFCLYCVAWSSVLLLHAPHLEGRSRAGFLSMMGEGIMFVRQRPVILGLLVLDFFVTGFGVHVQLMPIFAKDILHVGPQGLGILLSAVAFGALIASLTLMALGEVRAKGKLILSCIFVHGLALIGFGLSSWFWTSLLFAALLGLSDHMAATVRNAFILLITPNEIRGRMEAIRVMFTQGSPALGSIQGGVVANALGAPFVLAMGGVVVASAVVAMNFKVPGIRRTTSDQPLAAVVRP